MVLVEDWYLKLINKKIYEKSIFLVLSLLAFVGYAQQDELIWPRQIKVGDNYMITLYQPQLETLNGNLLDGRMALSVKDHKTDSNKLIFGALWFEARLSTDLESRTAVLESIAIPLEVWLKEFFWLR